MLCQLKTVCLSEPGEGTVGGPGGGWPEAAGCWAWSQWVPWRGHPLRVLLRAPLCDRVSMKDMHPGRRLAPVWLLGPGFGTWSPSSVMWAGDPPA